MATRVLFVCMGNICRSPTAEGVLRRLAADRGRAGDWVIDSAGTHGYHVGDPPDPRSVAAAARRGIDLSALRARRLVPRDFAQFDLVLVMDERNLRDAAAIAPAGPRATLRRFLDYAPDMDTRNVPDPYYEGPEAFERVLDLCVAAAEGLLAGVTAREADRQADC